jgi:hypothetical protein
MCIGIAGSVAESAKHSRQVSNSAGAVAEPRSNLITTDGFCFRVLVAKKEGLMAEGTFEAMTSALLQFMADLKAGKADVAAPFIHIRCMTSFRTKPVCVRSPARVSVGPERPANERRTQVISTADVVSGLPISRLH